MKNNMKTYKGHKLADMADVCELAHKWTVRECKKKHIKVDCKRVSDCGDEGQDHSGEDGTHYTARAQ